MEKESIFFQISSKVYNTQESFHSPYLAFGISLSFAKNH